VLHLAAGNLYGGIETFLVTLARQRHLCPEMEPHVALCFEGRLSAELRTAGVPVHALGEVRLSRPWTVWRARRRMLEVLAGEQFGAAVSHGCWAHAVAGPVVRRRRAPLVFFAHGLHAGRDWLERLARWTPPDLVVANSRATANSVALLFPGVASAVVHLPVVAPNLGCGDEIRRQVRSALGEPHDTAVVLVAARLEPCKGHEVLLDALARLRDVPGWVCLIAGGAQRAAEQDYLRSLQEKAAAGGIASRVRFLGQRSDVVRLLAAADIYCQPNTGPEGFGLSFVEALHAGVPVVTTALGGAREIMTEKCGVLVPPHDPVSLEEVLRRLIQDRGLRDRLDGGPARAAELCDPQRQLGRLAEVLRAASPGDRLTTQRPGLVGQGP
jgi:glycosyltransferase involved in cell wall biosynthesis